MYKKLIIGLIVIMSPLCCMEAAKSSMVLLNKDIACYQIQPQLTFQEISRLKRLSKAYNTFYNIETHCPYADKDVCSTYACNQCKKSYYQCTKMLVYFALKRNEQMFNHLWVHHKDIRANNITRLMEKRKKSLDKKMEKIERKIKGEKICKQQQEITTQEKMNCYRDYYGVLKKIHKHMFVWVIRAIDGQDIDSANTILSGSGLNIFDLCESGDGWKNYFDLYDMFDSACLLHDTNLIKNICGGCVNDRSFQYIVQCANAQTLITLITEDILSVETITTHGKKSVLHYAAERGFDNVIKVALEKGAYVNGRDFQGKTPLHYAAMHAYLGVVTELLNSADADVRLKDNKGRTAIDYNIPERKHLLHAPKMTDARKEIAKMLKDHRVQHQVSGYSYSRVHANGYQEIHL